MNKLHKTKLKTSVFSKPQLLIFILVFAVIGAYILIHSFAASNPNLAGDLNNDNTVNAIDLSLILSNYGTSNSAGDANSDNTVNALDLSIVLSHYGQSYSGTPSPISGQGYSLKFNEDFSNFSYNNSGSINDNYTWQRPYNGANNANAVVVDSNHVLHLYSNSAWNYTPFTLIGTRKNNLNAAGSYTYGYFEASIKEPNTIGTYPQWWLASLNQIWGNACSTTTSYTNGTPLLNPELDILEGGYGTGDWNTLPVKSSLTVHYDTPNGSTAYCGVADDTQYTKFYPTPTDGKFHTYGLLWTVSTTNFYLDGTLLLSSPTYADMNQPMYLILGSGKHNEYNGTAPLPSVIDTQVQWVHVWQK